MNDASWSLGLALGALITAMMDSGTTEDELRRCVDEAIRSRTAVMALRAQMRGT